jgi:hypothetical protein
MTKAKSLQDENSKKLVEESGGSLILPTDEEIISFQRDRAVYINKFMCSVLKNGIIKFGLVIDNGPGTESTFVTSFICNVNDAANLHQVLTKLLTSFQQQQQAMIQAAQGKVKPEFLDTIKAMQDMNKEEAAAARDAAATKSAKPDGELKQ